MPELGRPYWLVVGIALLVSAPVRAQDQPQRVVPGAAKSLVRPDLLLHYV
jgi:hypothetical protein